MRNDALAADSDTATITVTPPATIFTWPTGTSGNWSDASNWTNNQSNGAGPGTAGQADYTLIFSAAGTYTTTNNLNTDFLLNRLELRNGTVTLAGNRLSFVANGTALPRIAVTGSRPVTISNRIDMADDLTVSLTFSPQLNLMGEISGFGGLITTPSRLATLTLSGVNTYTGNTAVRNGTLRLGASNTLPATTAVSIDQATLAAGTFSNTTGTLDPTGIATINLGAGATLAFADSSAIDWTGGTLALTGTFVSGSSLRFGTNSSGLTSTQLAVIASPGFDSFALDSSGYLTANVSETTPPSLVSSAIVDDKDGAPITVGSLVSYTLTFSEDMNASTISAADFGNAGTASISIGTVTETTAGVFIVPVTPSSGGTLQLQVNAGAELKDVAGNFLNTNTAIGDDTTLTVNQPASIATQPVSQTVISGSNATLTVAASGYPAPTLQWYFGNSGDISNPIDGATSTTFVTPALTTAASYWVQATNGIGIPANSDTATISMATSDANLANLLLSTGTLSPAFTSLTTSYTSKVSNASTSISLVATRSDASATLKINDNAAVSGVASNPIPLNVGENLITIAVTSADLSNTKTYTLRVTRAAPLTLTTAAASGLTASSVLANGTVTPFGPAVVFFQYGITPAYGSFTAGQDVSGDLPSSVQANLTGLTGNTTYNYRLVAVNDGGTFYGTNRTFVTASNPPLAATGNRVGRAPQLSDNRPKDDPIRVL
ncbi:MAG: cadherin-like beta sandwich domain-containing protein [Luteolibacter sp.]